ncbi:MAG: acylneuraminate cytidylyltransferase family protein [Bacteroidota bacterium]
MIGIIPARGGSKGLPGKNIKNLLGKPMIAYTIEAALKSRYIDTVVVNTDSEEIASVAVRHGAECPFMRSERLATDNATSIDVFKDMIPRLESFYDKEINEIVILQPTSPLRQAVHIDSAIKIFKEKYADSVISYRKEDHPIRWHKYINNDGSFENIFPDNTGNRQDERPSYLPNGAIYVVKKDLINKGGYFSQNSFAYIMENKYSVDIDSLEDFEFAEFLLSKQLTASNKPEGI